MTKPTGQSSFWKWFLGTMLIFVMLLACVNDQPLYGEFDWLFWAREMLAYWIRD